MWPVQASSSSTAPAGRGASKTRRTVSLTGASKARPEMRVPSPARAATPFTESPAACSTTSDAGAASSSESSAFPVKLRPARSMARLAR